MPGCQIIAEDGRVDDSDRQVALDDHDRGQTRSDALHERLVVDEGAERRRRAGADERRGASGSDQTDGPAPIVDEDRQSRAGLTPQFLGSYVSLVFPDDRKIRRHHLSGQRFAHHRHLLATLASHPPGRKPPSHINGRRRFLTSREWGALPPAA